MKSALFLAAALSASFLVAAAFAATREGVRVHGAIRFADVDGDGTEDWLVGRAECFSKTEGQAELKSWCVALLDGRRWTPVWRKNVPGFGRWPPVLAGGWVVLDVGEALFSAFDARRPDVFWEFRTDGEHSAPLTPIGRRVLVVAGGDHLYFIDPAERRPLWDVRLWSPVRLAPVEAGGRVAVATDRELSMLDVTGGRLEWRMRGAATWLDAGQNDVLVAYRTEDAPPALTALDSASGERRWTYRGGAMDAFLAGPDQVLAIGGGQVVALDRAEGSPVWRVRLGGRVHPLGIDDEVAVLLVEVSGAAQELHAYDRETGKRRWSRKVQGLRYEPSGALTAGVLVVWSRERARVGKEEGRVEGIDAARGRTLWTFDTPEKLVALLSADARVVRVQRARGFSVLETRTGREIATHGTVALGRSEKTLSDRLRYLVYVLPPLIIVTGFGAWIRHRLRRRR